MEFGITAPHGVDPDQLVTIARHAESLGFDAFYASEHIALYPGVKMGDVAVPPSIPIHDPLQVLGHVAAVTERILLGTAVLLIPYHEPVALAKRLATLDILAKGRMRLFSVGVGALRGEAEAIGIDFATRGRRADEAIDALRLLWSGDENGVSFEGDFIRFGPACSYPEPYNTTTLPIHVGGSSLAAARRAGIRGDGYFAGGALGPDERKRQWEAVRHAAIDAGRDADTLDYTRWGSIDMTPDRVASLQEEGVTRIVVGTGGVDLQEQLDALSAFAQRLGIESKA